MIKLIKCPAEYERTYSFAKSVFLAGGITGCPDWQSNFVNLALALYGDRDRVIIDPRRDNFDASDPKMTEEQIAWEYRHLRRVSQIAFWFPKETLCPITLFELGAALERHQDILVGCHPDYARAMDLKYQIQNHRMRAYIQIVHTVGDLVQQVFED